MVLEGPFVSLLSGLYNWFDPLPNCSGFSTSMWTWWPSGPKSGGPNFSWFQCALCCGP